MANKDETKYRCVGDSIRYSYLIKNIHNKTVYSFYSYCDDAVEAMEKEGYNPNDWIVLIRGMTNC